MTSTFAAVITETATRGLHLTRNVNIQPVWLFFSDEDGLVKLKLHSILLLRKDREMRIEK